MPKDEFIHMRASLDTKRKLHDLRRADPDLAPASEIMRRLIDKAHEKLIRKATRAGAASGGQDVIGQ